MAQSNNDFKGRVCWTCGKKGHLAKSCKKAKKKQQKKSSSADTSCFTALKTQTPVCPQSSWVVDSGATQHFVKDRHLLQRVHNCSMSSITLANGMRAKVHGMGSVTLNGLGLILDNALFVKGLVYNILSVSGLVKQGFQVSFEYNSCTIKTPKGDVITLEEQDGLFMFRNKQNQDTCLKAKCPGNTNMLHNRCIHVWHRRFGHCGWDRLIKTMNNSGINTPKCSTYLNCNVCKRSKLKAAAVAKVSHRQTKRILSLVHMDLCGPLPTTIGGAKYFLVLVDDYSRFCFVYMLKHKSEAVHKIKEWFALMKTQFPQQRVQAFQSDRGGEFVNKAMKDFLTTQGIVHRLSNPFAHQENGIAERWIGILRVMARCLLDDAGLSQRYWGKALNHA